MTRYSANTIITCVFLALFIFSCGSSKLAIGTETVVERSASSKPDWILSGLESNNNMLFFSGGVTGVYDQSLGFRQARADAIAKAVEGIKVRARTEFTQATQGVNVSSAKIGRFVSDAVSFTADNVNLSGIQASERYYERIERVKSNGVEYSYNCYVLLQIPVESYKNAADMALNKLSAEAQSANDAEAQTLAEDVRSRLFK